jgi:hypothetical protein
MNEAYSTHERDENAFKIIIGKLGGDRLLYLEDIGVDGRKILKLKLKQ